MFSKSCEYGIQAILFIALNSKGSEAVGLQRIAESQGIPAHFLSKILQQLVKHRILTSSKGPGGGFLLNIPPTKLTLMHVVKAIDGMGIFDKCGIGLKQCSDKNPCPIHHEYKKIKTRIRQLLSEKTIDRLAEEVKDGKAIVSFNWSWTN